VSLYGEEQTFVFAVALDCAGRCTPSQLMTVRALSRLNVLLS
jgi:hypothetical protein